MRMMGVRSRVMGKEQMDNEVLVDDGLDRSGVSAMIRPSVLVI